MLSLTELCTLFPTVCSESESLSGHPPPDCLSGHQLVFSIRAQIRPTGLAADSEFHLLCGSGPGSVRCVTDLRLRGPTHGDNLRARHPHWLAAELWGEHFRFRLVVLRAALKRLAHRCPPRLPDTHGHTQVTADTQTHRARGGHTNTHQERSRLTTDKRKTQLHTPITAYHTQEFWLNNPTQPPLTTQVL